MIAGMAERVNYELQNMFPGPRVRVHAPGNVVERKYASWIGGSILASLGTFHQVRTVTFTRFQAIDRLILSDVDI